LLKLITDLHSIGRRSDFRLSAPTELIENIRIANHFEYLAPLTKGELFFDRKAEIQDTLVTCGQIVKGSCGGVLVLGGRGSGKTTFLNKVRDELIKRNIPNAKMSLDEGMVRDGKEMLLIKTILTELIRATENTGLIERTLAEKVLTFLSSGVGKVDEIGIDVAGFGLVAKASKESQGEQFPYTVFRDGLLNLLNLIEKKGTEKTVHGAILLLDEGDVLTLNRTFLQILRNVFQETPRIGLVISGSNKLLAQVGDVYSPIPRGFRKIELGPYPSEDVAYEAIKGPIEITTKELSSQGINIEVYHNAFDRIVTQISGRTPIEINMLCHFAFDLGAKRIAKKGPKIQLFMKADSELFEETIKQLIGAKEYYYFISELDKNESAFLVLLSQSLESVSLGEITALFSLNEFGESLQEMAITDVAKRIENSVVDTEKMSKMLAQISEKAQKHKITVLGSTIMGKPRFSVDDQWVRA
jgi:hypothetical protein